MKKTFLSALLSAVSIFLATTTVHAQGIMTTWVGTDTIGGYAGDNGPANLALLNGPTDVCFDADHNLYITDINNSAIRKVSAATNTITTIAGNGTIGNSGDGGLAVDALLSSPSYLCIDASGNLYFTDQTTNTIRKITAATGIITTIAGIPDSAGYSGDGHLAINSVLSLPRGICLDPSGSNLYFADQLNNAVRKIDLTTGIITTAVGADTAAYTGDGGPASAAALDHPCCVRFDPSGNLFIADEGNYVIRKVTMATGIITTVVGNNTYGWAGDGTPALGATIGLIEGLNFDYLGNMYLCDISCSCRKVYAATGIIYTVAGSGTVDGYNGDGGEDTSEYLNCPRGIFIDPDNGNMIIADSYNNAIRKATQNTYVAEGVPVVTATQAIVFPNPSKGRFIIQAGSTQKNAEVEIYNAAGTVVATTTLTDYQTRINISNQPPGLYFINIHTATGIQTTKMIVN